MDANKTFWSEFLSLYKELPALWRIKSDEYSNRILKNHGYEKLVEKLKEIDPNANRELVVRKINNLRTTYKKELKKVKESEKSGAGVEDIYEPTLWYYHKLSFLEDQEISIPGRTTMSDDENLSPRPKKKKICEEDNLIKLACEQLQAERSNSSNNSSIGSASIANSWLAQYEEMSSEQKIITRKIVQDVLVYGCLGKLTMSHSEQILQLLAKPAPLTASPFTPIRSSTSNFLSDNSNCNFVTNLTRMPEREDRPRVINVVSVPPTGSPFTPIRGTSSDYMSDSSNSFELRMPEAENRPRVINVLPQNEGSTLMTLQDYVNNFQEN